MQNLTDLTIRLNYELISNKKYIYIYFLIQNQINTVFRLNFELIPINKLNKHIFKPHFKFLFNFCFLSQNIAYHFYH